MRSELEVLAARLALEALTDGDLDALAARLGEMRRAARAGDLHAEAASDAAFHSRIVEVAANGTLQRVWQNLEPFSRTYITLVVPGADRHRIADLHDPILEALRRRDPELASVAIRRHFVEAGSMFASLWTDPETPRPVPDGPRAQASSEASAAPAGAEASAAPVAAPAT